MPQGMVSPKTYDAIIVGSGAGGGIAAHVLSKAGAPIMPMSCLRRLWNSLSFNAIPPGRGSLESASGPNDPTFDSGAVCGASGPNDPTFD